MTDELVERLRDSEHLYDEVVQQTELHHLFTDAADRIEALQSRLAGAEDALCRIYFQPGAGESMSDAAANCMDAMKRLAEPYAKAAIDDALAQTAKET